MKRRQHGPFLGSMKLAIGIALLIQSILGPVFPAGRAFAAVQDFVDLSGMGNRNTFPPAAITAPR